MIADVDKTNRQSYERQQPLSGASLAASSTFAPMMAQYVTTPLFAPWTVADQGSRATPVSSPATLNTHATSSNRREGRHAR